MKKTLNCLLPLLCIFIFFSILVSAQDIKENEVGFVLGVTKFPVEAETGIGGRFLHNYNSIVGFEFQGIFYPVNKDVNFYHGSFNLKGTYRMEEHQKVNFFGIVGPGFIVADPRVGKADTNFALTAGGGVEGVPHPKVAIRFDFADLIVFSKGDHSNNFDFKLSVMYRW